MQGHFGIQAVINKGKVQPAHVFFETQCSTAPEFAEVAQHLTTKPCGSGAAERDHKDTKTIWTKTRNRMEAEKVEKLKFRYSALRMRKDCYNADEINPKEEIGKYCEPEDLIDPLDALAPRVDGMVEDIQENVFNLFQEDWEGLCVEEKNDPGNRFRLSQKYCGIYMRDTSDANEDAPYDDYRVVVDLEWSTFRVRDYANKKGWVLVCELISPFHDAAIAEAGEDKSSIREAYIINETFFKCVQAAPSRLQTRPLKTRHAVGIRGGGAAAVE